MTVKCANARLHRTQTTLHSVQGDGCGKGKGKREGRGSETQRVDMHKCKCYGSSNGNTYANYSSPTAYAGHREKRKNKEHKKKTTEPKTTTTKSQKEAWTRARAGKSPQGALAVRQCLTHKHTFVICNCVCACVCGCGVCVVICMDSHSDTHSQSQLHALLWQVVHELITQWTTKCCIVHYRKTPHIVVVS